MWALLLATALAAPGPASAFIEVPGARLHYWNWGDRGEPLVLLPGGCQTAAVFHDLAGRLTSHFQVLALTPRGCGQSSASSGGYGIDRQIDDLVAFLDALRLPRAAFAGHSSAGGLVVRLARRYPARVLRVITFDIIYQGVPSEFESRIDAAISAQLGAPAALTLASHRARFAAWELGAWSPALEREFQEQTETQPGGGLRYRPRPPAWQSAFTADLQAGHYFETTVHHPALFLVAQDLDRNRLRQFSRQQQKDLRPLALTIAQARRRQLAAFRRNPRLRVISLPHASHYLFIDRAQTVARAMIRFQQSHPAPLSPFPLDTDPQQR